MWADGNATYLSCACENDWIGIVSFLQVGGNFGGECVTVVFLGDSWIGSGVSSLVRCSKVSLDDSFMMCLCCVGVKYCGVDDLVADDVRVLVNDTRSRLMSTLPLHGT